LKDCKAKLRIALRRAASLERAVAAVDALAVDAFPGDSILHLLIREAFDPTSTTRARRRTGRTL
jgi:hypothetical protein